MNHYDHSYSTLNQRRPLTALNVNNMSTKKRCMYRETNKKTYLVQHQYNCVQICKPLTIEDIQSSESSQ